MMCGRCDNLCPVGIDIKAIRMASRKQDAIQKEHAFDYIPAIAQTKANVIYFAGCMTHLQPSVKKSMVKLMKAANEKFWFMDEEGSICCGRPMMLSGKETQAKELIAKNKSAIENSGAKTLVTSCPICYKVFKDEYHLTIDVLHHSEYLLQLVESKKISLNHQNIRGVYHDPCELGRGSGVYEQPRELLKKTLHLSGSAEEKENGVCCGGSLANLKISNEDRKKVTIGALKTLTESNPEVLVTGCPACKKTFCQSAPIPVMDIAEVLSRSLVRKAHVTEMDIKTTKTISKKVEVES
jgi:Fe-S oxidoreductase